MIGEAKTWLKYRLCSLAFIWVVCPGSKSPLVLYVPQKAISIYDNSWMLVLFTWFFILCFNLTDSKWLNWLQDITEQTFARYKKLGRIFKAQVLGNKSIWDCRFITKRATYDDDHFAFPYSWKYKDQMLLWPTQIFFGGSQVWRKKVINSVKLVYNFQTTKIAALSRKIASLATSFIFPLVTKRFKWFYKNVIRKNNRS